MNPRLERRRLILASSAVSVLAACAAPSNGSAPTSSAATASEAASTGSARLVTPVLGQRFAYRITNRYNGLRAGSVTEEVIESGATIRLARRSSVTGELPEEIQSAPLVFLQESWWDTALRHEEPLALLPAGLAAPARASHRGRYRTGDDSGRYAWEQRVRSVGWERVSVPAGDFLCLRVEREINYEHPDPGRHGCQRSDVYWIAPELGRWIQREQRGEWHTGYGRNDTLRSEDWLRFELTSRT